MGREWAVAIAYVASRRDRTAVLSLPENPRWMGAALLSQPLQPLPLPHRSLSGRDEGCRRGAQSALEGDGCNRPGAAATAREAGTDASSHAKTAIPG